MGAFAPHESLGSGDAVANAASDQGSLPAPAGNQAYSADALVVFEKGNPDVNAPDIFYSFYGHNPAIPIPVTQTLDWKWWSIGNGGVSDVVSQTRAITTTAAEADFRPDAAFSREDSALTVWSAVQPAGSFVCPGPVMVPRYRGSIRTAQMTTQNNDDVKWQGGPSIDPPANTATEDQIYSNPSVAVDSSGTALVIWVYTKITHNCPNAGQMQVRARQWDGSNWVNEKVIAPNPADPSQFEATVCAPPGAEPLDEFCEHFTDVAFTAKLATAVTPATRQQAIGVWYDYIATATPTCFSTQVPVNIFWPKYAVWNGSTWSAAAEVPGRPTTTPPYMRAAGYKLGISADQYQNARLVFPVQRDDDPCSGGGELNQVYYSNWISNTQTWSNGTLLANGRSPDLALMQDNTAIATYGAGGNINWASAPLNGTTWTTQGTLAGGCCENPSTLAAVQPAGPDPARALAAWSNGYELRWSERIGTGAWSGATVLDSGPAIMPEIAARTGSPSLPHAEWSWLEYFAGGDPADAPMLAHVRQVRADTEVEGSTALVSLVSLYEDAAANAAYYYHKRGLNNRATLRTIGALNLGDANTLRNFIAWMSAHYPAKRYLLKPSDHGKAWRGACYDSVGGQQEFLTLEELTAGIAAAGQKLSHIVFHACTMATIETAYALRGLANYLVASEENMPARPGGSGIRNDHVLGGLPAAGLDPAIPGLINDPRQSDLVLAQRLVDIYRRDNTGTGHNDYTLSAINLAQVPALFNLVRAFAQEMNTAVGSAGDLTAMRTAIGLAERMRGQGGDGLMLRDLRNMAQQIAAHFAGGHPLRIAADNLVNGMAAGAGNAIAANWADTGHPNAQGLTIWSETTRSWVDGIYAQIDTGAGTGATGTRFNLYQATAFDLALPLGPPNAKWSSVVRDTAHSSGTGLILASDAQNLFIHASDFSGHRVGDADRLELCGGFCGGNMTDAECSKSYRGMTIYLPAEVPRFTWFIDGTLLSSSSSYTFTIQVILNGVVSSQSIQTGSISSGQVISGVFPPNAIYLPVILRNP